MRGFELRNLGWIVGLAAVLLAPAAGAEGQSGGAQPVIEMPETSQDGGTFEEGTAVRYQFVVANRGQADLEITEVKPSCGCTVTTWDHVIHPGAQGTIHAQMNTLYLRGSVTKHLTVMSNDPARPQVDLTISAHLLPLVKISPSTDALLVMEDKPVTQEFTLERSGGQPMRVLQVLPYAPYLKAEATPLPGSGRYRLTITATPDAPMGSSKAAVIVWTDLQRGGALTFYITLERGIATVPPMVFLGLLPPEMTAPVRASVLIHGNSLPFHIKSVSTSDPRLATKLETVRAGAEYRVTIAYAGGWDAGRRQQTLTITTDNPRQPVIRIPVEAVVQAKIAQAPASPPLTERKK